MASRSSIRPGTGAYSWSSTWMETSLTRGGEPGKGPVSGWPCPRLHHEGSRGVKPRRDASVVTKMTPVRGTARNAGMGGSWGAGGMVTPRTLLLQDRLQGDRLAAAELPGPRLVAAHRHLHLHLRAPRVEVLLHQRRVPHHLAADPHLRAVRRGEDGEH